MSEISRDVTDLVGHAIGSHHAYPDGLVLFCGTMFAPVADRGERGLGFTHQPGDIVTIATPGLGIAGQPRPGLHPNPALGVRVRRSDAEPGGAAVCSRERNERRGRSAPSSISSRHRGRHALRLGRVT